jgi:hypothetical protein
LDAWWKSRQVVGQRVLLWALPTLCILSRFSTGVGGHQTTDGVCFERQFEMPISNKMLPAANISIRTCNSFRTEIVPEVASLFPGTGLDLLISLGIEQGSPLVFVQKERWYRFADFQGAEICLLLLFFPFCLSSTSSPPIKSSSNAHSSIKPLLNPSSLFILFNRK